MQNDTPSRTHSGRPRRVKLFSLAVLCFGGGLNLVRAVLAWLRVDSLIDLPTTMPMALLAGTSLAWAIVFGACSLGLWRLRPWGHRGTGVAVTLFHGHIWINHFLFDRSPYARQVWPFALLHTLVTLIVVWGFLYWPAVRRLYAPRQSVK